MKKRKETFSQSNAQSNLFQFLGKKQPCPYQETNVILGFDWNNATHNETYVETLAETHGETSAETLDKSLGKTFGKPTFEENQVFGKEELFEVKHCPLTEEELQGKEELFFVIQSIKEWKKEGWKQKPLLLCGPSGTGKSMLIKIFMKEFDLWNETMLQEEDSLIESIKHMLEKKPLFCVQRCILIDCLDGLQSSEVNAILTLMKKTKEFYVPFIVTCDDDFDLKDGKQWKQICTFLKLQKQKKSTFSNIIQNVVKRENLKIPEVMLENLYEHSFGNVRFALNEIEFLLKTRKRKIITENSTSCLAPKDIISNVWETTQKLLLGADTLDTELEELEGDPFFPKLLYENATHITNFSYWDVLSQADVLEHKHSGLSLYLNALGTQAYGKKMKFTGSRKLQFPGMFGMEQKKYANEKIKKTKGIEQLPLHKWNFNN
jgi:DNA polymerase III delta prime subunit